MSTQSLIIVIGIAILANLVIMGVLIVTLVRRRQPELAEAGAGSDDARRADAQPGSAAQLGSEAQPGSAAQPESTAPVRPPLVIQDPAQENLEPVTAADDARRFRSVLEDEPHPAEQEAIAFFVSPPTALGPREEAEGSSGYEAQFEPASLDPADLTGGPEEQTVVWTDAPHDRASRAAALPPVDPAIEEAVDWERRVREEAIRLSRYRRPVTVVLVELDGFERLASRLGSDVADRLVPAIAETLVRRARATDHVARLGPARFGVLMPETDEIEAINYTERIRTECDRWLAAGSVATRLAVGWACPRAGADLNAAVRIAEERLQADRRRTARPEVGA
jgi:diguanylate cyclase (GGDEF)-like protein